MRTYPLLLSLISCVILSCKSDLPKATLAGELKQWHAVTLTFEGPESSEMAEDNPFLNYRLLVRFTQSTSSYEVPGYYAADGDAANSSANSGNKWKVHFSPDKIGEWTYSVSFRKAPDIAVNDDHEAGVAAGFMDGQTGSFVIHASDKSGSDFRAKGRLKYVGSHYLQFAGTGDYFLKTGVDAPENALAYADFDGDFHNDGIKDNLVKSWEPHLKDWQEGDPSWQGDKGKALIGGLNYLASEGLNAWSFLTYSAYGDDHNVYPYTTYEEKYRFDVSKLDQWNILFTHAQQLGIFLHFKTQEAENQGVLDSGRVAVQRRLYYRELIARFGHHLALNWNLGEENGKWLKKHPTPFQTTEDRRLMTQYFYKHDPYHHHIVIHNGQSFDDLLGSQSALTGPSVQTHRPDFGHVHEAVLTWREKSADAGKPWVITVDEPGDAQHSLLTDEEDPTHDLARINALWGTLMAGGAGIEWYFGYKHPHSDLSCEDWRSRDLMWDQCRHALNFFFQQQIPFWKMTPNDELVHGDQEYGLFSPGKEYVIFLKKASSFQIEDPAIEGNYLVQWYDPRTGEFDSEPETFNGVQQLQIDKPSSITDNDWVVWVKQEI
ncbi:MAG: DUF5060 domain-containing protein [Bacteroidota bacterium]